MQEFQHIQMALANAIRTGQEELSGVEQRRLNVYKDLFFNNVEGFCKNTFPVLASCLGDSEWEKLVRHFFQSHSCQSPHFIDISEEFLVYVVSGQHLPRPSLYELAHYEWLELVSSIGTATEHGAGSELQNTQTLYVSDSVQASSYQYPVHLIDKNNYEELEAEQTNLVLFKQQESVEFLKVDALSVAILQLLKSMGKVTKERLLQAILEQAPHGQLSQFDEHLTRSLPQFISFGIVKAE